jgi:hypothetical protein
MEHNSNEPGTFLTECVSDDMSAREAADSMHDCWIEAEETLAPVIGLEGLGVVFRHGEEIAERRLGLESKPSRTSIDAFCGWVRSLSSEQAIHACQAFLVSVENYLESLLGAKLLRRLLRRAGNTGRAQFTK